eukprot:6207628-Pleurochrysis_carterae.AAC.2
MVNPLLGWSSRRRTPLIHVYNVDQKRVAAVIRGEGCNSGGVGSSVVAAGVHTEERPPAVSVVASRHGPPSGCTPIPAPAV